MSNGIESKKKGHPFLVFLLGLAVGVAGTLLVPRYLPEGPWKGTSVQGTVLEKQHEENLLRMRISTDQGLMLATFSQKQADIDLLVQSGDQVKLRVQTFEPFVADPMIENVMRPALAGETVPAAAEGREQYVEGLERQLAQWNGEIADLRRRVAAAGGDARERSEELLADLEARSKAAGQQLAELRQASGGAWEELKSGVERAWAELEGELTEAEQEIEAPPETPTEDQSTTEPESASEGQQPEQGTDGSSGNAG